MDFPSLLSQADVHINFENGLLFITAKSFQCFTLATEKQQCFTEEPIVHVCEKLNRKLVWLKQVRVTALIAE